MSAKLTVIFYIVLCLEAGLVLTLLPWLQPFGLGDWGDNFFLLYFVQKTGLYSLQQAVSSGWVRGAVTGLGILNLALAFWEMWNFRRTVSALQANEPARATNHLPANEDAQTSATADLPDHKRHDDQPQPTAK
ncbi:MAG: hypothetical protein H0V88_04845 [Pyrinomonadaceae bacterium]|nr:hypothetical protein [Pyrinomonadaceae bacterium]